MPQVDNVTALKVCDAATHSSVDRVESLLASGVDLNVGSDELTSVLSGATEDWASVEKSTRLPVFSLTTPTRSSSSCIRWQRKSFEELQAVQIMVTLFQHGVDPYALFRPPIQVHHARHLYPGGTRTSCEETDLIILTVDHLEVLRQAFELEGSTAGKIRT
ncbi:hypothetical protein N7519_007214 [Penicillium mononematosum]|uniref:uncharacterized protein n=1 Tax=Penicillium mononematosum TaxID=268346 RepID=UPI002549348D|nr:uncharacterized protein N7519_007214 [Penicillium mononematosum]KAJ6185913.1 hypothetical protein N7519_007214 [Penicillium mononematosum]